MTPLPPLTWSVALHSWSFGAGGTVLAALLLAGYLLALAAVRRAGRAWPLWRTACWTVGLFALALSIDSAIGSYSHELFWMHMIQHLMLITVVPAVLVLGHPLALLQQTGRGGRAIVEALRRNPIVAFLTNPVVALALYTAVLVGTHLTSFMELMPQHTWLHPLEEALYLVSGYLFLQPVLAREPIRWDPPYPARLGLLFVSMIVDAGVGVALMTTSVDPFPDFGAMRMGWGPSPLEDVHQGGGLMWVGGDGLMMLAILVVALWWLADKERQNDFGAFLEAARRSALGFDTALGFDEALDADDRTGEAGSTQLPPRQDRRGVPAQRADRIAAPVNVDEDERALAAYNRMLARIAEDDDRADRRD